MLQLQQKNKFLIIKEVFITKQKMNLQVITLITLLLDYTIKPREIGAVYGTISVKTTVETVKRRKRHILSLVKQIAMQSLLLI